MNPSQLTSSSHTGATFATTRWTMVLGVSGADEQARREVLAALCRTYWPPVYGYLRRVGMPPHDAQDLTQAFFGRLLTNEFFSRAEPEKGRFRTFLLASLKNFVHDERERAGAAKRGGGNVVSLDELRAEEGYQAEPVEGVTPERLFERKWALTLLEGVLARLEKEFCQGARSELFVELRQRLWGGARNDPAHALAQRFGMSETAIHVMMHRLRARFRELIRAEIAELVAGPAEIDDEIAHLIRVLAAPV